MQQLTFNFDHPISGRALFLPVACPGGSASCRRFSCDGIHPLLIPVDYLKHGEWQLELGWTSGNSSYCLRRHFTVGTDEVLDSKNL